MTRVLVALSGPADQVADMLVAARARWPAEALTVVVRASQVHALADLLQGARVLLDKPAGGRLAFVRALREPGFAHGLVAWTGAFNYWPSKLAFALARVAQREVVTERGSFGWSWRQAIAHLVWRAKAPVHATAGMPPGIAWPLALVLCLLRATLGRILGPLLVGARTLARRAS